MESTSDNDSEHPAMLSYVTICDIIKPVLKDTKYPLKKCRLLVMHWNVHELHEIPNLIVQTSAVSVFDQVSLATMAKAQTNDTVLGLVIQYACKEEKPKGSAI